MGSAGGIFVGLKKDKFDVIGFTNNRFSIKATVKNKSYGFLWHLVIVYGSSYPEFKLDCISKLHDGFVSNSYPFLICGAFNLIRGNNEKSTGLVDQQSALLFNDWINSWNLMEIFVSNRKYTWSNNQENPGFAVLDRIFTSLDWDAHFPMSSLVALPRVGSDHAPLVLDTGARRHVGPKMFR